MYYYNRGTRGIQHMAVARVKPLKGHSLLVHYGVISESMYNAK